MQYHIGIRLSKQSRVYWENQLKEFSNIFDPKKIKEVQFGKQDIRGSESITLIDNKDCVPSQKHFENKREMLGFICGYNSANNKDKSRFSDYLL